MRKKFNIAVLFIIVIALGVTSCKTSKIDMDKFEEITLEQFEDAMEKIYDKGVSQHEGDGVPPAVVLDPPLELIYYNCDSSEEARVMFEEQYNQFEDYCEKNPDEVIMDIDEDCGFIVYNIIGTDNLFEVTGTYDYCLDVQPAYWAPQLGVDSDIPDSGVQVIHNYNHRSYGVIYYCSSTYIDFSFNADKEESLDQFNEFLDELGLPHM